MSERLLPEAIRGSWYFLAEQGPPEEALQDKAQLLAFRLDGTFVRYTVDGSQKEEKERGDYTFDGAFLILRGRNTDTYRVHVEADWLWLLEAKKKNRRLFRGLLHPQDCWELSQEQRQEIRTRPARVAARCPYTDEADAIFDLVFRPKAGDERRVGCCSVEFDEETGALWVGVMPVATNLAPEGWEKVIRKIYPKLHPGKADDVGWITLEVLGGDRPVREFDSRR